MLDNIYTSQRIYFDEGHTMSFEFRLAQLKKLKNIIKANEEAIMESIRLDLGKPEFEGYTSEIGIIYEELNGAIKNLKDWMKAKKVPTPIYLSLGKSLIYSHPKGVVLIISPWNYPFQLLISPLIGAIAAGNCAILRPSSQSQNTQIIIKRIIQENFDENYIAVIDGPHSLTDSLIEKHRLDHIFFTGSVDVGKKIAQMAADKLTPITLELGGKSPVIVHEDANLDNAAKNITWAKFFNMGQTCIAPDYLLVHENVKSDLIKKIQNYMKKFYKGKNNVYNNLGKIINEKRFDILIDYLNQGNIIEGGNFNRENLFIEPTLIDGITMEDNIMKEEIFGPVLPILTYENIAEVVDTIRINRYPLALYLFTKDEEIKEYILNKIEFGGGCINQTLSHIINPNLPFGGIGYSGMGRYHLKYSFDAFSYEKSIFEPTINWEPNLKYPPYKDRQLRLVKKIMK